MHTTDHSQDTNNNAGVPPVPAKSHQEAVGEDWAAKRIKMSLEASVLLGLANVAQAVDRAMGMSWTLETEYTFIDAESAAFDVGFKDFQNGFDTPSLFILNNEVLKRGWYMGREQAGRAVVDEIEQRCLDAELADDIAAEIAAVLGGEYPPDEVDFQKLAPSSVVCLDSTTDQDMEAAPDTLTARIEQAEIEAACGCGCSDVLYEKRVQAAFEAILDEAPDEEKRVTEAVLRRRGFDPDFEPYKAPKGYCSLTGIEENCCPCGRHP